MEELFNFMFFSLS